MQVVLFIFLTLTLPCLPDCGRSYYPDNGSTGVGESKRCLSGAMSFNTCQSDARFLSICLHVIQISCQSIQQAFKPHIVLPRECHPYRRYIKCVSAAAWNLLNVLSRVSRTLCCWGCWSPLSKRRILRIALKKQWISWNSPGGSKSPCPLPARCLSLGCANWNRVNKRA